MHQMLRLAALAAAAATAAAAPLSSNSSRVQELVGKDVSAGTMFEVNVFYDSGKTPDCTDKSVASVKLDPEDCVCLYTLLIACVASVKLDTSKASDDDETTIDASVYLGSDCTGQAIIGGDTDIPCDTCSGASLAPLGVTTQAICLCL